MSNVITVGKRLIALDQIAFVEPFDPTRNPDFKPGKDFKARLVLLNRDIVLTEDEPRAFAETHRLRFLEDDAIGFNPTVSLRVETFEPTEDFKPEKPFQTRLKWRDASGKEQSKLLLTKPEVVVEMVRGTGSPSQTRKGQPRNSSPRARRRNAASPEASHP